jgi:hypothetical protein
VSGEEVYFFAHQFYQDFRRLAYGTSRNVFDVKKYKGLVADLDKQPVRFRRGERARIKRVAERKIAKGQLKESDKEAWIRSSVHSPERWLLAEDAWKQLKVPGEPDVLEALLEANTSREVQKICKDAPNWPLVQGSVFPQYLIQCAEQFLAAKQSPRFPRSKRPSAMKKRLWFLSRALAGALFGLSPRTAVNLVGSKTPDQVFEETYGAKAIRKASKQRKAK